MPNFEQMDIDDLIAFRDKITAKRLELKKEFMEAGKVLDLKRQDEKLANAYKLLEAKREHLRAKMGEEPEPKFLKRVLGG